MDLYRRLLRPLLFRFPPETAHAMAHAGLHVPLLWDLASPLLAYRSPRLRLTLDGLTLPNPVGLAAGWDKNCQAIGPLRRLGFGYIVGGTVTPEPRPGNPKPRLVRDPTRDAAVNSMSFPNEGVARVAGRLRALRRQPDAPPLLVSIAANEIEGFVTCLEALQPLCEGIEVNISSPNTRGLRLFHDPRTFERLLVELARHATRPTFVKLPPYETPAERDNIFHLVRLCQAYQVTGVTVSNTRPVQDARLAVGAGGLSGRPLLPGMLRMVQEVRELAGPGLVIHASGGIFDGADALAALQRGADTVQVMTALWYVGPTLARRISRWLDAYLSQQGVASLRDLRHGPFVPFRDGPEASAEAKAGGSETAG